MTADEASRRFYLHVWPLRATVLRTAKFLMRDAAAAEDLAQEAMLKAYKAIGSLDTASSAKGWVMAILRNTRIDVLRKGSHESGQVSVDDLPIDVPEKRAPVTQQDFRTAAAIEEIGDDDLVAALKSLPEEIRLAVILVDVEELDYAEAAAVMDIPIGTAKSRVFRGRAMLRDALTKKEAPNEAPGF